MGSGSFLSAARLAKDRINGEAVIRLLQSSPCVFNGFCYNIGESIL